MLFINIVYKDGYKEDKEEINALFAIKNGRQLNLEQEIEKKLIYFCVFYYTFKYYISNYFIINGFYD